MTQNDLALLKYAMEYLGGCLRARKITLSRLEKFAQDEALNQAGAKPVEMPHETFKELSNGLAHKILLASLREEGWDKASTTELSDNLKEMLGAGQLTVQAIAKLCGTIVAEFQHAIDEDDAF
jgi:hypothetical protein